MTAKQPTPVYPNDFLGRAFADFLRWPLFPMLGLTKDFPMRLEEFTDEGHLVVRAELPGVDPEKDIEILVENGSLTIRGERRNELTSEQKGRHFSEMQYGSFARTIPLPEGVSEKSVNATYLDGILEVRLTLPKAAASKPAARIPVKR